MKKFNYNQINKVLTRLYINEQNIFILDFVASQEASTIQTTTSTAMKKSLSSSVPRSQEYVLNFDRLAKAGDQMQDQSFMNYLKRLMGSRGKLYFWERVFPS